MRARRSASPTCRSIARSRSRRCSSSPSAANAGRNGGLGDEARMKAALDWLTARPIAHRGLHDKAKGVIENTVSAALAAVDAGYAIECDVQLTGDGEAVVFHDFTLDRL